ncbi:MAG: dTDP-4-dehydrorhamnose reductase [bacterium]
MNIAVTGGRGMLGRDLCRALSEKHRVFCLDLPDFDITDSDLVQRKLSDLDPGAVIHCAAFTDVDGCERDPEKAFKVNDLGTQNVVYACMGKRAKLMYISTDYVFDGSKKTPYLEVDAPSPMSVYGKSKLAGEMAVRDLLHRFFIVRTSWLFGKNGKNFVSTILKLAGENPELRVVDDQRGSPTFAADLADGLVRLIESDFFGIYHLTNSGECTWYDFAREILEEAGIKKPVYPLSSEDLVRPAPRPANSVLANTHYLLRGFPPLRSYREGLRAFLKI